MNKAYEKELDRIDKKYKKEFNRLDFDLREATDESVKLYIKFKIEETRNRRSSEIIDLLISQVEVYEKNEDYFRDRIKTLEERINKTPDTEDSQDEDDKLFIIIKTPKDVLGDVNTIHEFEKLVSKAIWSDSNGLGNISN